MSSHDDVAHKAPQLTREESLDVVDALEGRDSQEFDLYRSTSPSEEDLNLPPGRMHAIRVPERLSGSSGNLNVPSNLGAGIQKRVEARPRSRSHSPSLKERATITTHDANSSISSLDDIVDQDILYDRAGFSELDASESQRKMHSSRDFSKNLPPVSERLCEDTLEDVHAFSDVARSSNASRVSVSTGNNLMLDPLDECAEDDEEDDFDDTAGETLVTGSTVILTNMENLTLQQGGTGFSRAGESSQALSRTGESSIWEEAPSGPTT